jgi:hypothetical protein
MLNNYRITIINTDTMTSRVVFKSAPNAQQAHRDTYFETCENSEEIKSIVLEVGEQQIEAYNESHGFTTQIF